MAKSLVRTLSISMVCAAFAVAGTLWAQESSDLSPTSASGSAVSPSAIAVPNPAPAEPAPAPDGETIVLDVLSENREFPERAGLHDRITFTVSGLGTMLAGVGGDCSRLIVFLDGVPIAGTPPESCNPDTGKVRFELDRTDDSDSAWHALLGKPSSFIREVPISIGPAGGFPAVTKVADFDLIVLPKRGFFGFFALLVAALLVFLRLAVRTNLLRDPGPSPGTLGPFNLARVQLAFWFFLVLAGFVFIWLTTQELDTISGSVVALLGIGSGTAIAAGMIDSDQRATSAAAGGDGGSAPPSGRRSTGFVRDLMDDGRGLSLYHFQLGVWTLVLGIIFCSEVYHALSMPEFNGTLLGLLGISSGTFLGAKVPAGR